MRLAEAPDILTVKELQQILGLSKNTTYELIHSEGFPRIQLGERQYRVLKDNLIEWLNEQTTRGVGA